MRVARNGEKEALVALPETWFGEAREATATVRLWSERRARLSRDAARDGAPGRPGDEPTYAARFTSNT